MCLRPKKIYRAGIRKEDSYNGKKGDKYDIETFVKCGTCIQCQNEKANNWVIRNIYEKEEHEEICFITLTYKDNPIFLIKKDIQDFIKRLRRYLEYHEKRKIRFFARGEYGQENGRPHAHILIYGWEDKNIKFERLNKKKNLIYKSEIIEKLWGKGITAYQKFDKLEIPYISAYATGNNKLAKAYKTSVENAKKMVEELEKEKNDGNRIAKIRELNKHIEKAQKEKAEYIKIKEFNLWSQGIGKKEFLKKYKKENKYIWKEYFNEKEFLTPTPWVKQLANKGDKNAIEEMAKREEFGKINRLNEKMLTIKNNTKELLRHKDKVIEYVEQKKKNENF